MTIIAILELTFFLSLQFTHICLSNFLTVCSIVNDILKTNLFKLQKYYITNNIENRWSKKLNN